MLWGFYEKDATLLFKEIIKPGMTVVDIGAHIGYFTRLFAKLAGPKGMVYAFEADPENFELLKKNTGRLKNVKIYQVAVTDKTGTIDFYHCDEKAGCHSILPNTPLDLRKRKVEVEGSDLDTLSAKEGINRIDLIKMDIEGGESKALEGMQDVIRKNDNLKMMLEFAPAWIKASGDDPFIFLKNLESWGFKIFVIKEKLIPLELKTADEYRKLLPKVPTAYNEFIDIYCVK